MGARQQGAEPLAALARHGQLVGAQLHHNARVRHEALKEVPIGRSAQGPICRLALVFNCATKDAGRSLSKLKFW